MTDWPVGLSTGCFFQMSIFDVLEDIRNGGFSLIEICSFPKHLDYHDTNKVKAAAQKIRELGMQPFSFHAPFADDIDITSLDDRQRDYSVNEILKAAEAAVNIGAMHFVIHPGPEKEEKPPTEEHFQRMKYAAHALNRVVEYCKQHKTMIILENMLPHLLFGSTSDLLWIMGALKEVTNVGICLDTGHANLSGDLYNVMYKMMGHLQMLHAADNRGTHDDHFPPGKGHIDWKKLLWQLNETGFRGGIIMELAGENVTATEGILHDARQARTFLQDITRDIEVTHANA